MARPVSVGPGAAPVTWAECVRPPAVIQAARGCGEPARRGVAAGQSCLLHSGGATTPDAAGPAPWSSPRYAVGRGASRRGAKRGEEVSTSSTLNNETFDNVLEGSLTCEFQKPPACKHCTTFLENIIQTFLMAFITLAP